MSVGGERNKKKERTKNRIKRKQLKQIKNQSASKLLSTRRRRKKREKKKLRRSRVKMTKSLAEKTALLNGSKDLLSLYLSTDSTTLSYSHLSTDDSQTTCPHGEYACRLVFRIYRVRVNVHVCLVSITCAVHSVHCSQFTLHFNPHLVSSF